MEEVQQIKKGYCVPQSPKFLFACEKTSFNIIFPVGETNNGFSVCMNKCSLELFVEHTGTTL